METITTYSGVEFAPRDPDPTGVSLADIAHALSLLCRGNGHVAHFYSVGQHSLNCAREAAARGDSPLVQLGCLLHDASEAYLCDIPRPLKAAMETYRQDEARLQRCIEGVLLPAPLSEADQAEIKAIDDDLLYTELPRLLGRSDIVPTPLAAEPDLDTLPFAQVEQSFLDLYHRLLAAYAAG